MLYTSSFVDDVMLLHSGPADENEAQLHVSSNLPVSITLGKV